MIARLFNVPVHDDKVTAMGTSTIGSSEAIMLGILAMKKKWSNKRKAEGKPYDKPNLIMNSAVQVCWEKGCSMFARFLLVWPALIVSLGYFDVEEKYVYCTEDRFVLDPETAVELIDENTIGICVILGSTFNGEYEYVPQPRPSKLKPTNTEGRQRPQ